MGHTKQQPWREIQLKPRTLIGTAPPGPGPWAATGPGVEGASTLAWVAGVPVSAGGLGGGDGLNTGGRDDGGHTVEDLSGGGLNMGIVSSERHARTRIASGGNTRKVDFRVEGLDDFDGGGSGSSMCGLFRVDYSSGGGSSDGMAGDARGGTGTVPPTSPYRVVAQSVATATGSHATVDGPTTTTEAAGQRCYHGRVGWRR
jgi:hypothetical protein